MVNDDLDRAVDELAAILTRNALRRSEATMIDELKEEEIVNKVGGRFKLSTLIQKRMIALNQGARRLVEAGRRQDDDRDPGDHAGQDLPRHVGQPPDGRADRGAGGRRGNRRSYPTGRMSRARPLILASGPAIRKACLGPVADRQVKRARRSRRTGKGRPESLGAPVASARSEGVPCLFASELLRSAPALAFCSGNRLPRLEPGRLRSGRCPRLGRRSGQPLAAPDQSLRTGGRDPGPCLVHHPGLVVLALAAGPVASTSWLRCGRQVPDRLSPALGFALLLRSPPGSIHKLGPGLRPSPPVGSGGYLGALAAISCSAISACPACSSDPLGRAFRPGALPRRALHLADPGSLGPGFAADTPCPDRGQAPRRCADGPARSRSGRLAEPRRDDRRYRVTACARCVPPIRPVTRRRLSPSPRPIVPHRRGHQALSTSRMTARTSARGRPGSPFELPPLELLEPPTPFPVQEHEAKVHARAMLLERTLLDFGYQVRVVQIDTGPVITQFEIELEAGLRVSRIMSLADDLAIALAVPSVRIVAPIPGKTTVGIEVPNDHRDMVRLGEVIAGVGRAIREVPASRCSWARTSRAQPLVFDLADMPHLLMAAAPVPASRSA